ncbi:substrate-binding domain-containing protein [Acidisoma silvae]|uniref:Substrate-binding domain-containing protein n=1 Tax=Acidisoma silvae TaxID=2802396 RepID=A0A964E0E3_9PROT|nr:substrate-binding domain-containing protein [Acidisoma silvae]MCB8876618.1 substrate-binding domain-containing protein [Acidisoma silvae]
MTLHRTMMASAAIVLGLATAATSVARADTMADAKAFLAKYASHVTTWDGPTTGPKAVKGKSVVVVAGDMKNGGILGATKGFQEAAKLLDWNVRVIDGAGTVSGRTSAFSQALALKPDGIVLEGFDPIEQRPGLQAAQAANIPIVAWHASPKVGPIAGTDVRVNVSTDAMLVAEAAADWAYIDANGKPAVVVFTDGQYQIAVAKAKEMERIIKAMGGKVLAYEDTPIADTSTRMPQLTTSLLQKFGAKWTHSLAINDIYFDFMGPSLEDAGVDGTGNPKSVAAGDGSRSAYERIRAGQYQSVTVAEPLTLQGWQLVDEMNRAFAGQPWSGYVAPFHVVTQANIAYDGGPQDNFDPDNGYRDHYKAIWGVQ